MGDRVRRSEKQMDDRPRKRSTGSAHHQQHRVSAIQALPVTEMRTGYLNLRQLGRWAMTSKTGRRDVTPDQVLKRVYHLLVQPFQQQQQVQGQQQQGQQQVQGQQQQQQQGQQQQQSRPNFLTNFRQVVKIREFIDQQEMVVDHNTNQAILQNNIERMDEFLAFLRRNIYALRHAHEKHTRAVRIYKHICIHIINNVPLWGATGDDDDIELFIQQNMISVDWLPYKWKAEELLPAISKKDQFPSFSTAYDLSLFLLEYTVNYARRTSNYSVTPEQLMNLLFSDPVQNETTEFGFDGGIRSYRSEFSKIVYYTKRYTTARLRRH